MRITTSLFGLVLTTLALASAAQTPSSEPATQPTTKPKHALTYKLSKGSENWDPAVRDRIIKAMDVAVGIYNANGDFNKVLTVNFNPGTPTADANYDGWINFGGQISSRTAEHEIAHTLGVGTHPNWRKFVVDGKWTGKNALDELHKLDGPDAVLHADRQHFWPYGLNYDSEAGGQNRKKNVLMVIAFRKDLGIKDPG